MHRRTIGGAIALAFVLGTAVSALAWDDAKYPDWKGQWDRIGGGMYDPSKRGGRAQQPPLTDEYRAIWEANLAEEKSGGQSYNTQARCLPGGMPRMMIAYQPLEMIITPDITYVAISFFNESRRIYTDGRAWPDAIVPTFSGYSIGRWIDTDSDGRFDTLEVETRGLKGPRGLDPSGIPLHQNNKSVVRERIALDKADSDILRDEITLFDDAFTRPWTVTRSYRRDRKAAWIEDFCAENNMYLFLGKETYFITGERLLMPTRKGQPAPDLRKFGSSPP